MVLLNVVLKTTNLLFFLFNFYFTFFKIIKLIKFVLFKTKGLDKIATIYILIFFSSILLMFFGNIKIIIQFSNL